MRRQAAIIWGGVLALAASAAAQPPRDAFPQFDPAAPRENRAAKPAGQFPTRPPDAPVRPGSTPATPDPLRPLNPAGPSPGTPILPPGAVDPRGDSFTEPQGLGGPGTPPAGSGPGAPQPTPVAPAGGVGLGDGGPQRVRFSPRTAVPPNLKLMPDPTDPDKERSRFLYTGGLIVTIEGSGPPVELAADRVVAWIRRPKKNNKADESMPTGPIDTRPGKTEVELYLTGNVVVRTLTTGTVRALNAPRGTAPAQSQVPQTIHADEAYYDATRNRGVYTNAQIDVALPGLADPLRLEGREIDQLGRNHFELFESRVAASKRPGDPGLNITANRSVFTRAFTERTNLFGIPYRNVQTGQVEVGYEQLLTSYGVTPRAFDIPFFYLPRAKVDVREPFGPLAGFATANNRVLGYQLYTTFDLFKLFALRGPAGHRWLLYGDYYGARGPAIGTQYNYTGFDLFGLADRDENGVKLPGGYNQPYGGLVRAYVVNDTKKNRLGPDEDPRFNVDILGGFRGPEPIPPAYRTRLQFQHNQDIWERGTDYVRVMAQAAYFSDKNFYEQYYKNQFDTLYNQESFAYLQAASNNAYGSLLAKARLDRPWETETEWLPQASGAVIGQSFLELFTNSFRADAGYANLATASVPPLPVVVTDRPVQTGRFHVQDRLELPLDFGPVRVSPYGVLDLAYYTSDISRFNSGIPNRFNAGQGIGFVPPSTEQASEGRGRFYGAGGVQTSTEFSRLYGEAASELFNVSGLYHKVTLRGNYYNAYSDTPYYLLPQLDRLNDDATDQAYRETRPIQNNGGLVRDPAFGQALATSPLFDPQQYAIRRAVDNRVDTLDSLEVLQLGIDQRLQTKRGFPGAQHTVDWMTLNASTSVFPQQDRDNYGQTAAFYEYYFLWHLGDRTSLTSSGWYDPIENGARYASVGANFTRPDGTNFFVSYRHTDPLKSRAVTAVISYNLNRKYSLNVISTYDFGLNSALSNQVSLARTGADVTVLFGVSYTSLQNNFGLQLAVVPNLLGAAGGARLTQSPFLGNR